MPAPNDGQTVAAAWEAYVNKDPVDNIFDRYWLLENLKRGQSFEEQHGRAIFGTVEYATNSTVTSLSELETIGVTRVDVFDQFEFAWKLTGGLVVMSEFEKAITEAQGGKFRLMARKIANLKKSMDDSINAQLFSDGTGNSSKDMGGLQDLVSSTPTSGTVGQIDRGSFTFWQNQQNSGAQTTTAYDNLQSALRTTYNDCSNGVGQQNPDFGVMTQTDFEGYEGLLDNNERYVRSGANDKGVSGFKGQQLMFKDIPLAYDDDCPSQTAYILNNRNLKLVYARWMRMFDAVNPANQFIEVPKVLTIANLVSDNPRRLGVVTAID